MARALESALLTTTTQLPAKLPVQARPEACELASVQYNNMSELVDLPDRSMKFYLQQIRAIKHSKYENTPRTKNDELQNEINSAFFRAIEANNLNLTKALVKTGADLEHQDHEGSCLHKAAQCNNPAIVDFLITQGVDVNAKDRNNYTPLIQLARRNPQPDMDNEEIELAIARSLIEAGAEDSATKFSKSTLDRVLENSKMYVFRYLSEQGFKLTDSTLIFPWSSHADYRLRDIEFTEENIEALVEAGFDLNVGQGQGNDASKQMSILAPLINQDRNEELARLLNAGISPDHICNSPLMKTGGIYPTSSVLIHSLRDKNLEAFKALLRAGAQTESLQINTSQKASLGAALKDLIISDDLSDDDLKQALHIIFNELIPDRVNGEEGNRTSIYIDSALFDLVTQHLDPEEVDKIEAQLQQIALMVDQLIRR